jgi:uncharacterized protein
MNILKRLWAKLFRRKPDSVELVVKTDDGDKVVKIPWNRINELLKEPPPTRGEYRIPARLPGVWPAQLPQGDNLTLAMDSSGNQEMMAQDEGPVNPAAWGIFAGGGIGPGISFLGFPYLAELEQITEYRTPAESLSTEMTRVWGKLKNNGKKDLDAKLKEITDRMEELKVRDLFRQAALKTEFFGRSHIYVSIKGQDNDLTRQLPLTTIEKGTLLGFSCIEPYWLTPYSWNATHPEREDFYKPQSWFVIGRKTHASRLLTFIFREVPDLLKPAYDFSGISVTQLMMPYVNRWLRTAKNVNDLINIFSIVTLATDLASLLQDPTAFVNRLRTFNQTRDNRGLMVVNKNTEELSSQNIPLGSLDKLQAQSQEHMATPARMPLIKFFGITPTGLNTTSEGEFQSWYDYVHALQELGFGPNMQRVLEFVQMDLYGSVDPDIKFEFLSLYEPNGKEKADIRKADADRDAVYITNSVVSPAETRNRLRMDPDSGYSGLEGEPPEPQQYAEMPEGEGEEGEDDDEKPPKKKDD